jgi:hypothetical protein
VEGELLLQVAGTQRTGVTLEAGNAGGVMTFRHGFPERRRIGRGEAGTEPTRGHLVSMILGTFREMPGLTLHPVQAERLFGLRTVTCEVVLQDLTAAGHLRQGADGQYAWAGDEVDRRRSAQFAHPRRVINRAF